MKIAHVVWAALVVAVLAAGLFLFLPREKDPAAVVSTTITESADPNYWTEERMRNAKPVDNRVGPSVEFLVGAAGVLGVAIVAGAVVVLRRRR